MLGVHKSGVGNPLVNLGNEMPLQQKEIWLKELTTLQTTFAERWKDNPEDLFKFDNFNFVEEQCESVHALSIILMFETTLNNFNSVGSFSEFVNALQLSTQSSYDNLFKTLLNKLEFHPIEFDQMSNIGTSLSLLDLLKLAAEKIMKKLSQIELSTLFQKEDFYQSLLALKILKTTCSNEEYRKILHEHDIFPAVQVELAKFYSTEDPVIAEKYYLRMLVTKAANYVEPDNENIELLMKHLSLEQLQFLSKSGNSIATMTLIKIYLRNLFLPTLGSEKFADVPVDHEPAKECLNMLESNSLYAKLIVEYRKVL